MNILAFVCLFVCISYPDLSAGWRPEHEKLQG